MKKMLEEFKAFIMRGNVLDMAVGVVVATAFGKITTALINNILMPFISWIFGTRDTTALNIVVREAVVDEAGTVLQEAITLGFGTFVAAIVDFILIAAVVFLIVKASNKAKEAAEARKKAEEEAVVEEEAPAGPSTEELLAQILDELKKK